MADLLAQLSDRTIATLYRIAKTRLKVQFGDVHNMILLRQEHEKRST